MKFVSTRGTEQYSAAEAVVMGLAPDGGLFVPSSFPEISKAALEEMLAMDYPERVAAVLGEFFGEFGQDELLNAAKEAYAKFEGDDPAPLVRIDKGLFLLELFHGPTCAFKDMALTLLPFLLKKSCELLGIEEKVLVVTATSGDTGKAALEGFREKEGVSVVVFYPEEGVSKMQKLQMGTTEGDNVDVIAVRGNFDDCQTGVKKIFSSETCKTLLKQRGYILSSANSINFGRLAPQIAYYFSAYLDLVTSKQIKLGDKVDFAVPTGNFGNVLAAYYAERMGLPVGKLLVASNKNCALSDLWRTGIYDVKRPFFHTMSPSMDILISSNFERLLFELTGRDAARTAERMQKLAETGKYTLRAEELNVFQSMFFAGAASEDETVECMYDFFMEYGYPMDTHTGVAMSLAEKYRKKQEDDPNAEKLPTVVLCTASPYKFPQDVLYALTGNDVKDSYKGVKRIHLLTAMKVPEPIRSIRYKPVRFKTVVSPDKMFDALKNSPAL